MGSGFSVQMIFIFIDTDGKEGSGFTEGLPGLNVQFAAGDAWDQAAHPLAAVASPRAERRSRPRRPAMKGAVIVPSRTKGAGRTITGTVGSAADLGGGDPSTWGFQVVVQSNEGFPPATTCSPARSTNTRASTASAAATTATATRTSSTSWPASGTGDAARRRPSTRCSSYECNADGTREEAGHAHDGRREVR